jgi:hypothetical protein
MDLGRRPGARTGVRARLNYANVMATVAVVAALGGGAFAVAAVTGAGKTIDACYVAKGDNQGSLRLLVKGKCGKREKPISWNQRGIQGVPGAQGSPGPATGPASGDLTGNYPDPTIANGAVNSAKVAADSLAGANILESSLGTVPAATTVGATLFYDQAPDVSPGGIGDVAAHPLASVNGLVMTMRCIQFGAGSNQTVGYVYVNPTGAATVNWMLAEVFSASGGSADTVDINGASLPGGEYEVFRFNNVVGAGAPVRVEGQLVFRTASGQVDADIDSAS